MNALLKEQSIGSILFKSQIITEDDITTALEEQKKTGLRFGETLVSLGIVRQEDIDWALSHQLNIPYVRIHKESVDPAVLRLVPAAVARKYDLLPVVRIGDELGIAIADPLDRKAIAEVERLSGCSVSVSMGLLSEIREMQEYFYGVAAETGVLGFSSPHFLASDVTRVNRDVTGAELLDFLLLHAHREGLSSVSFKPLKNIIVIDGRRGATISRLGILSPDHYETFLAMTRSRAGISSKNGISSTGFLSLEREERQITFRIMLAQAEQGEYMTLKPVTGPAAPVDADAVRASVHDQEVLSRFAAMPAGLILFSSTEAEERVRLMEICLGGPAGAGKDIVAIGKGFSPWGDKFPVLPADCSDADMSRWIRAAAMHDPAVMAVEEISSPSAFTAAFEVVLGKKLLFAGVSAPGIRMMLQQLLLLRKKLPLLPLTLSGVAGCKGIRLLCPDCKEENPSPEPLWSLLPAPRPPRLFREKGCHSCCYSGYVGKRYLVEAALFDQEIAEVFDTSEGHSEVMDCFIRRGFKGIVQEAGDMLQAGEITAEDFILVSLENGASQWPE